jgi:hypothetical protein
MIDSIVFINLPEASRSDKGSGKQIEFDFYPEQ